LKIRKGKGGKDRNAVLNPSAILALSDYQKIRPTMRPTSQALWISRLYGSRICNVAICMMLKKYAKAAKVTEPVNPHAWRHGIATELLRRGASIREVQVFLGHASPRTTQIYTHVAVKDLKEIHQKTHPRERDPEPADLPPAFSLNCFPKACRLFCYVCSQSGRRAS
jgi:integrase/recombinase XerD